MAEGLTIDGIKPLPGGAFSALTPSMWPQEILAKLGQPEVSASTSVWNVFETVYSTGIQN